MRAFNLLFFAVCFFATALQAQNSLEVPYVEATGTAIQEVMPDEFYMSVLLKERYDGRTKITIQEQEENLRRALIAIGIPDSQFSLSDVDADFVKVRWNTKDVITQKNYTVLVNTTSQLSKSFEVMEELDIKDAYLSRVGHSAIDSLRREVRIEAVQAAKEKASYMLNAIGANIGAPLIVREQEMFYNYRENVRLEEMYILAEDSNEEAKLPELNFQKIRLEQSVFVRFAISDE